jgi:predicted nucleic acid-binding protein
MILVDGRVWRDYFDGAATRQTDLLDALLGTELLAVADLVVMELLTGHCAPARFALMHALMMKLTVIELVGSDIALQAARHGCALRARGVGARPPVELLIATRCLATGYLLLHNDGCYAPYIAHLGLRSALGAHDPA